MLWGHRTTTSRSWGILVPSVFREADTRRLFQQTPRATQTLHFDFCRHLPTELIELRCNRFIKLEPPPSIRGTNVLLHRRRREVFRIKGSRVCLHDNVSEGIFTKCRS